MGFGIAGLGGTEAQQPKKLAFDEEENYGLAA
jgi:hypothetical protein